MPIYEYACDPCRTIFQTRHGINDPRPNKCWKCSGELRKVVTAPNLNTKNHTSPTAAKYANLTVTEELAREAELQKVFETIWVPPEVKHDPWDENH